MSDVSKTAARGLLIPTKHVKYSTYSSSLSSVTQAGPLPGIPVAQQDTEMVLEASGEQAADLTINIKCQESGMPGPNKGKFVWKYETDTANQWRGTGVSQKGVSDYEAIDYTTTADKWHYPNAIRLQNDTLLCLVTQDQESIVSWTKARDAASWTSSTVYTISGGADAEKMGCVLQLPSGRILAFLGTKAHIITCYSDDNGVTWTLATNIESGLGYSISSQAPTTGVTKRMCAAYINGQVLLLIHTLDKDAADWRDRLYQYASPDLGSTWDYVSTTTGYVSAYTVAAASTDDDQNSRGFHDILTIGDSLFVCYLKVQNTTTYGDVGAYCKVIGSAYQNFASTLETALYQSNTHSLGLSNAGAVAGSRGYLTGDFSAAIDEDGTITFIALSQLSTRQVLIATSYLGTAASTNDVSFISIIDFSDANKYIRNFSTVYQLGRLCMFHNFKSDTDNHDDSLICTYLGGYTTLAYHPTSNNSMIYMPFFLPEDIAASWTKATVGVPVINLNTGKLKVVNTGPAVAVNWRSTSALSNAKIYIDASCTSAYANSGMFVIARLASGLTSYAIKVLLNDKNIIISDYNGGTLQTITTASVIAAVATGIQLMVIMNGDDGRVWYRPADLSVDSDADHLWTDLGTFTGLVNGGVSTTNTYFGVENDATVLLNVTTAYFKTVSVEGYSDLSFSQFNPTSLFGRNFSQKPQYIDGGTRLAAIDGPGFYADQWDISTRYTYGVENLHSDFSPSPRRVSRSTTDASNYDVVWDFDSTLNQEDLMLGDTLGINLQNINFRNAELYGYDVGTASYVLIANIDAAYGQNGLSFNRIGKSVVPLAGVIAQDWFTYNTLVGSYVKMTNGGTSVVRKITAQSEGGWGTTVSSTKQARLQLEGIVPGLDPSGGGAQTLDIWSKDVLVVIDQPSSYSRFKLRIIPQTTYEGYFSIGNIVIGHVAYFGQQYSRGRSIESKQNTAITTSNNGTRRSENLGPSRRSVEFAWIEGLNAKSLFSGNPVPDYITGYVGSTTPEAAPADVAFKMQGIADALNGSDTPIVYIPYIPRRAGAGVTYTCTNRNHFMYCRLMTDVRIESIMGDEAKSEVFQVATITLEEEL